MNDIVKRSIRSFFTSAIIGMICLLLIELIGKNFIEDFSVMTPEFIAMFPSGAIALEVDILLYGVFGMVFSAMTFIYEIDKIGFVIQNMIYAVGTAVVWVPIVIFMWQLQKYPKALISTIAGFFVTYIIMTVIAYRMTKKELKILNDKLKTAE